MNIELHIERLILDGLSVEPRHRAELQAAVEAELTRWLAADGLRAELLSGGAVRSLGAGEIHMTNQTTGTQLGNDIARVVHEGIGTSAASAPWRAGIGNGFEKQPDIKEARVKHE